ncbi:putative mitotic apparatus protein p62 [Erysiphe neolycopersici]|uniref:Putative mitotic apparatus protein p62 n=1 Tax=Erysiphe neolycopersici TaxID=212602 RepID=A0A420I6P5_9PEZI|nr:putative mitotic apparatus protein p62 [Erysiphe neolycopersici]
MNDNNLIRIPCSSEEEHEFVLVHVSYGFKNDDPLSLIELTGSEGENVYTVTIENGKKSSGITWRGNVKQPDQSTVNHILSSIFLPRDFSSNTAAAAAAANLNTSFTDKYYAIAEIKSDSLILTIQRKVEFIIEKIGDITLLSDELDISLFDWCNTIIESRDKSLYELNILKSVIAQKNGEIEKLNETLNKMTKIKREHENELLEKFALLLNEKKAKIRDQYRWLQSDSMKDSIPDSEKQTSNPGQDKTTDLQPKKADPPRRSKRKVTQAKSDSEFELDTERIDDLDDITLEDFNKDSKVTPDASETETDEEKSPVSEAVKKIECKSKIDLPRELSPASIAEEVKLPPKRQLPFSKKDTSATSSKMLKSTDNSEADSDDEL